MEENTILHVGALSKTKPYKVTVWADECNLTMEVDTRSSVSLISQKTYKRLWLTRELTSCSCCLQSYSGESIEVL